MAAPTLVQEGVAVTGNGSASTLSPTLPGNSTLGNVVAVDVGSTSAAGLGVSGFGVTTWAQADIAGAGTDRASIYWGIVDGTPSSSGTVSGTTNLSHAKAIEISGVGAVDVHTVATGVSTAPATGSITTTHNDEFLLAYVQAAVQTAAPSAGPTNSFNALSTVAAVASRGDAAYRIVASTGTYNTGWTYSVARTWSAVIVGFYASVQNLTRTATEAPTTADSAARTATFVRTATAAPQTTDSPALIRTLARAATAAPTTTDVPSRTATFVRTATEAPATADVAARTATFVRTVTSAPVTSDSVTGLGSKLRTATEAPATTDVPARIGAFVRTATAAPATTDVPSRAAAFLRATTEAPHTADVATDIRAWVRSATEAPATADVASRVGTFARTATAAPATSDVAALLRALVRTATAAPATSDAAARVLAVIRTATEAPTTAEVISRGFILVRAATEAPVASVVATRLAILVRTVTMAPTTSDVAVKGGTHLFRTVTEHPTLVMVVTTPARRRMRGIQYHAVVFAPDGSGGPGTAKMELDPDILNLVWQQVQNGAGQAAFALYRRNPKVDLIEWMVDHIKIYRERADGTIRTVFAGKMVKPVWSAIDVQLHAWDYNAFLQLSRTGYRVAYGSKKLGSEVISPEWTLAQGLTNGPFTFVDTGTIEDPLGQDGVTLITTNADFIMSDLNRLFVFSTLTDMAMANTVNNVKFEITRETPHTFNLWKNYGANKHNYAFTSPGNLAAYDLDMGYDAARHDLATVLGDGLGGHLEYTVLTADANTTRLRRLQAAMAIRTLFGVTSGTTEGDQGKAALARQLNVSQRVPRSFIGHARQGDFDPFIGNDLGDMFRHTIQNAGKTDDLYDGYLRWTEIIGSWNKDHGELLQIHGRGTP